MSNKRVNVKALQRGGWVIMVGDLVKQAAIGGGLLQYGEVAKVIRTYYLEIPVKDTGRVVREGWVALEIIKPSIRVPASMGLQIADKVAGIVPADYVVGAGIGNGGRTFDQFVEQHVSPSRARVG